MGSETIRSYSLRPHVLVINGSVGGSTGNTWAVAERLCQLLASHAVITPVHLAEVDPQTDMKTVLDDADAFVFVTGTYWDSWGSPLQAFLEKSTQFEGTSVWMGKAAAVLVTMHSVGGKEVLSRLQGVLATLGVLLPPMCGMVYSLAGPLAQRQKDSEFLADLWQLEDLEVLTHNLLLATALGAVPWRNWPVDDRDPGRRWVDLTQS